MPSATDKLSWQNRPFYRMALAACAAAFLCVPAIGALGQESRATEPAQEEFPTNAQATASIRSALEYLYSQQRSDGTWENPYSQQHPGGVESLVLLSALSAGESDQTPALKLALKYVDRLEPGTVYVRSIRTMVYARLPQDAYGKRLAADVYWLVEHQNRNGGWGYGPKHSTTAALPDWRDTSNSQLALLALNDAADAGATVPPSAWQKSHAFWLHAQNADGGWGYDLPSTSAPPLRPESYGSMTAAGAASLCAMAWRLAPDNDSSTSDRARAGAAEERRHIASARKWLGDHYAIDRMPKWPMGLSEDWLYYYHFCLERAALSSGQRTLGSNNWSRQIASMLLERQKNGYWRQTGGEPRTDVGSSIVPTCFAILDLLKCQQPVLVNRLDLDAADGYDVDALARLVGLRLGRAGSWQDLSTGALAQAIEEAPILYLSGSAKARIPASADEPIRRFVRRGGTVLVVPRGGAEFADHCLARLTKLLPSLTTAELRGEHPAFGLRFRVDKDHRPSVVGMSDAFRTRIFIMRPKAASAGQLKASGESVPIVEFVANLVLYTTDMQPPRGRLRDPDRSRQAPKPLKWITVARVRHLGAWDVCPEAMDRLSESLAQAYNVGIKQAEPVDFRRAVPGGIDLLWLTSGEGKITLDQAQRQNLLKYLQGGGTIFVDAATGDPALSGQMSELLAGIFGRDNLRKLPVSHALLTGQFASGMGADAGTVEFTAALGGKGKDLWPVLWGVQQGNRVPVIFSQIGLTCPLEGIPTFGCRGLATPDARRLAANIALYAATQK